MKTSQSQKMMCAAWAGAAKSGTKVRSSLRLIRPSPGGKRDKLRKCRTFKQIKVPK